MKNNLSKLHGKVSFQPLRICYLMAKRSVLPIATEQEAAEYREKVAQDSLDGRFSGKVKWKNNSALVMLLVLLV